MKNMLKQFIGMDNIYLENFNQTSLKYERQIISKNHAREVKYDFIYVASTDAHKNHRTLIEAWCLLAERGVYPSLGLTININKSEDKKIWEWIQFCQTKYQLKIINIGIVPHRTITEIYLESGALIFPSTSESLGLPLIEARVAGLPILASELDFVRDTVDPEESFNPYSAISICRAVLRYLNKKEEALPIISGVDFISALMTRNGNC